MMRAFSFFCATTCRAMPVTARRTLAWVNSSATMARHPEVPNLILLKGMATVLRCGEKGQSGKATAKRVPSLDTLPSLPVNGIIILRVDIHEWSEVLKELEVKSEKQRTMASELIRLWEISSGHLPYTPRDHRHHVSKSYT